MVDMPLVTVFSTNPQTKNMSSVNSEPRKFDNTYKATTIASAKSCLNISSDTVAQSVPQSVHFCTSLKLAVVTPRDNFLRKECV